MTKAQINEALAKAFEPEPEFNKSLHRSDLGFWDQEFGLMRVTQRPINFFESCVAGGRLLDAIMDEGITVILSKYPDGRVSVTLNPDDPHLSIDGVYGAANRMTAVALSGCNVKGIDYGVLED